MSAQKRTKSATKATPKQPVESTQPLATRKAKAAEEAIEVKRLPPPPKLISTGKPSKIAMRRIANFGQGFGGRGVADSYLGAGGNFYSPELSTDFLELPQSIDEQRNFYRFFYENDPFIAQAIDLQTDLPLSKLRLQDPEAYMDAELAKAATRFCTKWANRINLLDRLAAVIHEYNLIGTVPIWVEDNNPDMPEEVMHETVAVVPEDDSEVLQEKTIVRPDAIDRAVKWLRKNYKGWTNIQVLPPEQVQVEHFPFSNQPLVELTMDSKTKALIERADSGDERAQAIVDDMPSEIIESFRLGTAIPLNTDPAAGSFCYVLTRKRSDYEPHGHSLLQRVLKVLVHRDKLRQAQASIASRHMTPMRIISAEDLSEAQVEELRDQVDLAMMDPDYSIVTNFQVNWEEKGGGHENRLLDLNSEYEITDRQLYAGLGVTESLLSGESSYSGDRINLEVINIRHNLLRMKLAHFVEKYLFEPMCRRMGYVEHDEDGDERVLVPRLSFTRIGLRDNAEVFDILMNLYQKGSLDIRTIFEVLNIDADLVEERLQQDKFTMNDSSFNEVLRGMYSSAANTLVEQTDLVQKLSEVLDLKMKPAQEEGGGMGRFANKSKPKAPPLKRIATKRFRR
jgi:hypothetical protein